MRRSVSTRLAYCDSESSRRLLADWPTSCPRRHRCVIGLGSTLAVVQNRLRCRVRSSVYGRARPGNQHAHRRTHAVAQCQNAGYRWQVDAAAYDAWPSTVQRVGVIPVGQAGHSRRLRHVLVASHTGLKCAFFGREFRIGRLLPGFGALPGNALSMQ